MKIAIAADHAGVKYKAAIIEYLTKQGHSLVNFGTDNEASCDYADFAHPLAASVEKGEAQFGILICGTANGMMMTANKHSNIRAGLAWTPEVAGIIRAHNDANILGIPARFVSLDAALAIVTEFFNTSFEGGRHETRIKKIPC